jgi:hypothetical protein
MPTPCFTTVGDEEADEAHDVQQRVESRSGGVREGSPTVSPMIVASCTDERSRPGVLADARRTLRFASLIDDVERKLFSLPDSTWFYLGHGSDSTVGTERPSLP